MTIKWDVSELFKNSSPSWYERFLCENNGGEILDELSRNFSEHYSEKIPIPEKENIFNAFKYTPFESVKAVILGLDPYKSTEQAHGLAFSVPKEYCDSRKSLPRALKAIVSNLNAHEFVHDDFQSNCHKNGLLAPWTKNVLLLNAALTVPFKGKSGEDITIWKPFSEQIIRLLVLSGKPIVFMLWGKDAQHLVKEPLENTDTTKILPLISSHPSARPWYNDFVKKNHFSEANDFLKKSTEEIDWCLG